MELTMEPKSIDEQTVLLKLTGEMDIYTAPRLKDKTTELIKGGASKLIIEMSELKYIDSIGLGTLVAILAHAKKNKGNLCLVSPSKPIRRLLEIVGIDKVLSSYSTLHDALKFFNNPEPK